MRHLPTWPAWGRSCLSVFAFREKPLSQSVPICPILSLVFFVWFHMASKGPALLYDLSVLSAHLLRGGFCREQTGLKWGKYTNNSETTLSIYILIYIYIFNTLIISADPCRCHCRGRRPRQRSIGSGLFLLHWQAVQELAAPRPSGPSRSLPSTAMLLERGEGCFFPGCSFLYIYRSIDR